MEHCFSVKSDTHCPTCRHSSTLCFEEWQQGSVYDSVLLIFYIVSLRPNAWNEVWTFQNIGVCVCPCISADNYLLTQVIPHSQNWFPVDTWTARYKHLKQRNMQHSKYLLSVIYLLKYMQPSKPAQVAAAWRVCPPL